MNGLEKVKIKFSVKSSGLMLIFSPRVLGSHNRFINSVLVGFGLFEVTASLISDPDEPQTLHADAGLRETANSVRETVESVRDGR